MRKEEVRIEGGRYLIYYWFDDEPSSPPRDQGEAKVRNKLTNPITRSSADEDAHQRRGNGSKERLSGLR